MIRFRLIDQKLNSKDFFRPLVVTQFRSKKFNRTPLISGGILLGGVTLLGGVIFLSEVIF